MVICSNEVTLNDVSHIAQYQNYHNEVFVSYSSVASDPVVSLKNVGLDSYCDQGKHNDWLITTSSLCASSVSRLEERSYAASSHASDQQSVHVHVLSVVVSIHASAYAIKPRIKPDPYRLTMFADLLADGQARVADTLKKSYAPSHFVHNLELVLVKDHRVPSSTSMKNKIISTHKRCLQLRNLDPHTLVWWATAFPMRQWSGGRKISGPTFESLVRYAPQYAVEQVQPLLSAVSDDLRRLLDKHVECEMLHHFLHSELNHPRSVTGQSSD